MNQHLIVNISSIFYVDDFLSNSNIESFVLSGGGGRKKRDIYLERGVYLSPAKNSFF